MRNKIAILCLATSALFAQSERGNVTGVVTDQTGASVPGAELVLTQLSTNSANRAVSGSAGEYNIPNLIPGAYRLEVTATGFKKYLQQNLTISAGGTVRIDAMLQLGQVSESIEITAAAATIQTENAKVTTLVETSWWTNCRWWWRFDAEPVQPGGGGGRGARRRASDWRSAADRRRSGTRRWMDIPWELIGQATRLKRH
jgi:hypothetical protein